MSSIYNFLRLVRNMRQESEKPLIYDGQEKTWEEVFELHAVRNRKNKELFSQVKHCSQVWGESLTMLRSEFTWNLLCKIADNGLNDSFHFSRLCIATLAPGQARVHGEKFFRIALTALWLGHEKASKKFNHWSAMNQEEQRATIKLALETFGHPAYTRIAHKSLKVENLESLILLWFWHTGESQKNKLQEVLHVIDQSRLDSNFIGQHLSPGAMVSSNSLVINDCFLPWSDIWVDTNQYHCNTNQRVLLAKDFPNNTMLQPIMDLLHMQNLLLKLQDAMMDGKDSITYHDNKQYHFSYMGFEQLRLNFPLIPESRTSLKEFIKKQLPSKNNPKHQQYWTKVDEFFTYSDLLEEKKEKPNQRKI